MAETIMTYTVRYERDEAGFWVARIATVPGCHTQGRTLEQARRRIREALSVCVDDPAKADAARLIDDVQLPAEVRKVLARYRQTKQQAERSEQQAARAARQAITTLQQRRLHLSSRDTAALMHLSHQRVHQLATAAARAPRKQANARS